ncbi:hypothetical protein [uncultured Roseibium sp.]|uniref:hypothetical protein n=1 Tax=uncultured Roseibium sp. TaxID=1936171 RepID=UPI00262E2CBE|nr:hypothetical protein [uncultured Roseibium sp.]
MSRTEKWIVPDWIYCKKFDAELDGFIKSLPDGRAAPLANRWQNNSGGAIDFGRRALEVSVLKAQIAERDSEPLHHDWTRVCELASKAQESLDQFVSYFTGCGEPSTNLLEPMLIQFLAQHEKLDVEVLKERARENAKVLMAARTLAREYTIYSKVKSSSLASNYQNPGNPRKLAFVEVMFEAWAALTGKLPSRSRTDGPFIRFLQAAWADLHLSDLNGEEDFATAITRVHKKLKNGDFSIDFDNLPLWHSD